MNKHYAFWPFKARSGSDGLGNPQGAGAALREFRPVRPGPLQPVKLVRYGNKKHRLALASCNDSSKSLYVVGHGAAGVQFVYNTVNGDDEAVHALVVVARLMEYGLKKSSECKLKLFSCHSGSDGAHGGMSLARAVHLCLRQLGFPSIGVFGYTTAIAPYGGTAHTGYIGVNPVLGVPGVWLKASTVRVEVPG